MTDTPAELPSAFVVLRSFTSVHEAQLATSALEAFGIEAHLADEHLVSMAWTYSNAIGGVKVLVPQARSAEALQVLEAGAGALDEPSPLMPPPADGASGACPRCGGTAFGSRPRGVGVAILSWLTVGFPITSAARRRYCLRCGAPDDDSAAR